MEDALQAIAEQIPELIKLGGWGALIALFLTRRVVTKQELDDARGANEERIADKDKQIIVLTKAVQDGDAALERLAIAWEAAISLITRRDSGKG